MKSVVLVFLTCLASYGWASPLPTNIPDTASNVARQKFSTAGSDAPLDEKHPAIRAANRIEDPQNNETALKLSHVFQKNVNPITDWLKNRIAHADNIYCTWEAMTPEERPILTSCELWGQEVVSIEELSIYLKESWRGSPLVVGDDIHTAVLYLQRDEEQKTICAHFYDPYEPFEQGSSLELKALKKVIDALGNDVGWLPHYTKHQKLTAFGECSLYASAYRSFLLKNQKPDELTDEVVLRKVASLKEVIREQHPEYFKNYDGFFQFAFDSGFAKFLLEEIKADALAEKTDALSV